MNVSEVQVNLDRQAAVCKLVERQAAASDHFGKAVDDLVAAIQDCGRDSRCAATLLKYGIPQKLSTMGFAMEKFAETGRAVLATIGVVEVK